MKTFFLAIITLFSINSFSTTVYASSFGWNSTDATTAFRNAINSANDIIIIDKQAGDWIVQPNQFFDLTNKTIIFENDVVLRAKAGAFTDVGACLFQLIRCKNLIVKGYGATFKMNRAEAAANQTPHSEWRHSISIDNCSGVSVYGLKLDESGGDGVLISGNTWYASTAMPKLYSENILLKDLRCDKNFRQGISVGSVEHLLVQNCWFTNTAGTAPESGVDLEQDYVHHRMSDVVFEKCRFIGNNGNGIQVAPFYATTASEPISVTFRDCYTSSNHVETNGYSAAEIAVSGPNGQGVAGFVKFERCLVENSQWNAVNIRKTSNGFSTTFDDCAFINVSQRTGITPPVVNSPIFVQVTDYSNACPSYGGATFNNCIISYNTNYPYFGSYGNPSTSPGIDNVKLNNLTVIHPNSSINYANENLGSVTNCIFNSTQKFITAPSSQVSLTVTGNMVECNNTNSTLTVERLANNNLSFPMQVTYSLSGDAYTGSDFSRVTYFEIIPKDATSKQTTLEVIKDNYIENTESFGVTINQSNLFTTTSTTSNITVVDCQSVLSVNENILKNEFKIYPNPATENTTLEYVLSENSNVKISVYDMLGKEIFNVKDENQNIGNQKINIDTSKLQLGIYIISLGINDAKISKELIISK